MGDDGTLIAEHAGPNPMENGVVIGSRAGSPLQALETPKQYTPLTDDRDHRLAAFRLLVRDFVTAGLKDKEAMVERLAREAAARYPGASVDVAVEESYRNMREVLDNHPLIVECARQAISRAGVPVRERAIRGGTDGSRLSFMGLPTPNLFAGEHNFHSRLEWVSAQDMDKAVETIVNLCRVWEERTADAS